ncbi:hypothetical protein [Nocardia vinacea]|uniref:hypothetical protein n=1 Tax=Nocardia vinacea TaxID=96468 RepID=UPI000594E9FF|nr:hypothetical protein [Nocardia vinacea]
MAASNTEGPGAEKRLTSALRFLVDEVDGVVIFVAAAVVAVATLLEHLKEVQAPALVAISIAVGVRVFRVKYQMNDISSSVSNQSNLTRNQLHDESAATQTRLGTLEAALLSGRLHEAEMCDRSGFYRHMLAALREAHKSVDLTQLDSQPPKHYGTPEMVEYFDAQTQLVRSNSSIKFRRIIAIPTLEKLEWVVSILDQVKDCANFQINMIDLSKTGTLPPPLSLQIFDRREMCLVDPTLGFMLPEDQRHMLWVKGSSVAEVFAIYYDSLWQLGTRVKEGSIIYWDDLETLARELSARFPDKRSYAKSILSEINRLSGAIDN